MPLNTAPPCARADPRRRPVAKDTAGSGAAAVAASAISSRIDSSRMVRPLAPDCIAIPEFDTLRELSSRRNYLQVSLGLSLALSGNDLIGIDPHHHISDVIRDLGEPMPRSRRNDHHITRLE